MIRLFGLISVALLEISSARAGIAKKELRYAADVPEETRIQLEADLERFFSMAGSNPSALYREVFGSFDRKSSEDWFYSRVKDVGSSLCNDLTNDGNAVACVLNASDHWIFLTPNYTKFAHPSIARLSVLFHEARHTEWDERYWPHAKCPRNFVDEHGRKIKSIWTGSDLGGEMACDAEKFGSYGIQAILLLNIAYRCDNCSAEDREQARIYGMDQLRRIIYKPDQDQICDDIGIPRL